MPGKARRRKGKYSPLSKKRRGGPNRATIPVQQPAVVPADEPISSPQISVPLARVPTPMVKPADIRYPHIATELRTISIMAGVVLVILVVLALVLA